MKSTKTAQIAIYCGLFVFVYFFSSFDLAVTATVSAYVIFTSTRFVPVLFTALFLLLLDIIFHNFDIRIRIISDLLLDAYILFLIAAYQYIRSQNRYKELFQKIRRSGQQTFSNDILKVFGICVVFSLLLLPITGIYLAMIIGYISFSYLAKKFEGKYAYSVGLIFLFFCPFFIIAKKDDLSEMFAIFSFIFLIIGTIQEAINIIRLHKNDVKEESGITSRKEIKDPINENKKEYQGKSMLSKYFNFAGLVIVVGLIAYFALSFLSQNKVNILGNNGKLSSATPSAMPTEATEQLSPPVEYQLSSSSAVLKINIENGTEVAGLAATSAAKLKAIGFKNVETGNARKKDYKNWEITFRENDEQLMEFLKKSLDLQTLIFKQSSPSAISDILIIAGENK